MKGKGKHIMPISISDGHLPNYSLEVFVSGLHCSVHLGTVWRRNEMLDFILVAQISNLWAIQILSIVSDNLTGESMSADNIILEKFEECILRDMRI